MNIEELKRLAEAASPGQWLHDTTKWSKNIVCGAESDHIFIGGPICETRSPLGIHGADPRCEKMREANAAFIAAAREAVPKLIQQRDKLLAALELFMERVAEPPEANCSCHISPPCNDCVENWGLREAFSAAKEAIAKAEAKS